METIRQVAQFKLNYCPLQKMYNITNEILLDYTKSQGVSYWFNGDKMEDIMLANDETFVKIAKRRAGNDIYSLEVFRNFYNEFKKLPFDSKGRLVEDFDNPFRFFHKGESKKEILNAIKHIFKIKEKFK